MFDNYEFWKQCIFKSSTLKSDFTEEIHADEQQLAKLIQKGLDDVKFRNDILIHTKEWECNNKKSIQFDKYEQLIYNIRL